MTIQQFTRQPGFIFSQVREDFNEGIKRFTTLILTAAFGGCVTSPQVGSEEFVAAPSPIDHRMETASIEDYVLALPLFEFHEESVEQFAGRVRSSRGSESANAGKDRDFLFVRGDGSAPSKEFVLDRRLRRLTIRSLNREPGANEDLVTMRRVPGGWMRGPRVERTREEKVGVLDGGDAPD